VSKTAGALTSSLSGFVPGDHVYRVGHAVSANTIQFDPEYILEF
jgi:hypothetical protein